MIAVFKKLIGDLVNKCMLIFTYLPEGKTEKQNYIIAITAAVAIHLLFGIFLLLNTDFNEKPVSPPKKQMQVIDAVVIDQSKLQKQVEKLKQDNAAIKAREDKRIKDLEKRAADAKKKRQNEADKIKTLETQRKKKEAEKKKADDAAKKSKSLAAAEEKKRKQKELERQQSEQAAADAKAKRIKAEADEKKAADDRRRKKLEEQKRKKEAADRAEQERILEQQMQEEMASRQSARSQQVMTEVEKYKFLVQQAIQRHFINDEASMRGKSCKVQIKLASSGFVISAKAGNGDPIVCREAVKAVTKAGSLPVSKDPEVFSNFKSFTINYIPKFN